MSTSNKSLSLPAETWSSILEWTTYVPNAFDTHPPDVFAYPGPWTEDQVQEGIRQSISTKYSIVLVCKQWNVLATRYLYQAITIREPSTIFKLARTFKSTTAGGAVAPDARPGSALGKWTKRLDISLSCYSCVNCSAREAIGAIFHSCSKLEILVYDSKRLCVSLLRTVFDGLLSSSIKLRKLSLVRGYCVHRNCFLSGFVVETDCRSVINTQPGLRVLRIPYWSLSLNLESEITIPAVEYLDTPWYLLERILNSNTAHSVSHFSMDRNRQAHIGLTQLGSHLTSLEVDDLHSGSPFESDPDFATLLREIANTCPNLQELVICLRDANAMMNTDYLPPVRKLGIRVLHTLSRRLPRTQWISFCADVISLTAKTRTIEVIRLLYIPTLRDHGIHARVFADMQQMSLKLHSKYQVRFEGFAGCLLHEQELPRFQKERPVTPNFGS